MAAALALLQHHQYSVSDISPGLLFSLLDDDLQRFQSVGQGGRPRLRPWHHVLIAQVVKRYERRRVVETERRIIDGTPARVETLRRRSQGDGVSNTAAIPGSLLTH